MGRTTVDFGIDLGTTNSCIALLEGTSTRVIRTNVRSETTPSVVSFDRKGRLYVGEVAKTQQISSLGTESNDVCIEFKLSMGHSEPFYTFQVNGKPMTPEELSAEVLKQLRNDVQHEIGEVITASAIGIPANFESPQSAATHRAAEMAGLSFSPTILEPVAAALAYGFQTLSDRVFWMVYDFGGGTFDAAIIQIRDEQVRVVSHGGDNHLGGKLIDLEIVEQILAPAVIKEFHISPSSDIRWGSISRILKYYAEIAKIQLSVDNEAEILIRQLFTDGNTSVPFEYELKRSDIERISEPFIERSINKCKNVLADARVSPSDIEKLILVGGPTLMPLFREMLSQKMGISLEFKEDPLTVVARGAAIFAGTQRIPEISGRPISLVQGEFKLDLAFEPIGDKTEPEVGGKIIGSEDQTFLGYTIEFVESKTLWRSGKIAVNENGTFFANVGAEKGRRNEFLIELKDTQGNPHKTIPDRIVYTIGITVSAQITPNNIGLALQNGNVLVFVKKNTALPVRHRETIYSTTPVYSGNSGTILRIPVIEGDNLRADRNHLIGFMNVSGNDVKRDVPVSSEVEVTIDIDESQLIRMSAHIPILDEDFEEVFDPRYPEISQVDLVKQAEKTKGRLEELKNKNKQIGNVSANEIFQQIDKENLVSGTDLSNNLAKQNDKETLDRQQRCRIELDVELDKVEELIAWSALVVDGENIITTGHQIFVAYPSSSQDKDDFYRLENDIRKAIKSNDPDFLRQRINNLAQFLTQILERQWGWWVSQLERLNSKLKNNMSNQVEAERLISLGYRAVSNKDFRGLQIIVRQLYGLLPATTGNLHGYESTVLWKG